MIYTHTHHWTTLYYSKCCILPVMSNSYSFEYSLYCHFFLMHLLPFSLLLPLVVSLHLFSYIILLFFHLHHPEEAMSLIVMFQFCFLIEISCKCVSNFNRDNLLVLFLNVSCKYMYPFSPWWRMISISPLLPYFGFEL